MTKLKIAIQKKGRLSDKSMELFKKAGIKISNGDKILIASASNYPVEILFLRDDDIPGYVEDGVADVGIVGENVILEKQSNVTVVQKLGFAKCRMSLAVPKEVKYTDVSYFEGKKIATSYPKILQKFLKENNVNTGIQEISGSVEISPGIGLADGIFDIVSTGSTLISNGLKEVEEVLFSEAVLISNKALTSEKLAILNRLNFRINALQQADTNKYILLNAPNDKLDDIISIIPGMKSPTVLPLAEEGWSSVHSVVEESRFWGIIEDLKDAGAQGILVVPIEKMIL